jgi:transcriptional regulator with XRE-family HTH domain
MAIKRRNFPPLPTATFPQRVAKMMTEKRLSQSDVAREVGYTPTAVWNWLQGNTLPRPETLVALSELLEVDIDWLRDGESSSTDRDENEVPISSVESISDRIESLRAELSAVTGCEIAQVKITVEFGPR